MIDFKEVANDGETWELFARDFLEANGFYIEQSVDRGADGGKDMIVSEHLKGTLGNYKLRWLVSCKNYATSKKAVSESDEQNLLERMRDFQCDGFIGFYSTLASSAWNTRLASLKEKEDIKDYRIFDYRLIENSLVRIGFSKLVMRYFPQSYKKIHPIHLIETEYVPLKCRACDKDLLPELYSEPEKSSLLAWHSTTDDAGETLVDDFYWAHKGDCDRQVSQNVGNTFWKDISDLTVPPEYLRFIFRIIFDLQFGRLKYTEKAYEKMTDLLVALAQKVLREMTEEERKEYEEMRELRLV